MNNSVLSWRLCLVEDTKSGFSRTDSTHLLDFYLGFDSDSRHTLLLICDEKPEFQSGLKSVNIKTVIRPDGRWSLFLTLEDFSLLDMFTLLCGDLIESSRDISDASVALEFVLNRLMSWRLLFERGGVGLLTEAEIRGLCGELLYLQRMVEIYGSSPAVSSWVGPYLADQDFQMNTIAWEIKTVRPGASAITISSERQLDTRNRSITLVVFELANCSPSSTGAFTLNSLVKRLKSLFGASYEARMLFDRSLFKIGYIERSEYNELNFAMRECSAYSVVSGFPCIMSDALPAGISDVNYKLDLSKCKEFKFTIF
ncbi:PD-(D/E)XK motif protein [Pseudomonas sp. CDFA 610]|uniref:PD-(D/E)XK motif protein n=1 Tax=Pseudomonas sp. CDFA 610 TaxID=2829825 RepID=UPI001E5BF58B|nr:PD-(D/E)XK motif protein [Pseudomonas sp. CDFA 610]MCD5985094.1 PD-(D/E)XK motif protein [Pseudomonas sp. CDFA 610]MEE4634946.1 PD-(D/E)XK motif protein [Pseudomonas alliivorans]